MSLCIRCTRNGEITYDKLEGVYTVWSKCYSIELFSTTDVGKAYDFYETYLKTLEE